ncbi:MAG: HlyD family efflux transporter periplasmic adaptor subunit, partial [Planctomycetota bacterium]
VIRHWRRPARSRPWRWRRSMWAAGGLAATVAAVWCVPMPRRVWAPIVLELSSSQPVYVTVPGKLAWHLPAGTRVASGDLIARLENEPLADEERRLAAELAVQALRVAQLKLRLPGDSSLAPLLPVEEARWRGLREQQGRLATELARLVLRAERAGVIVEPPQRSAKSEAGAAHEVGFADGPQRAETAWNGSPLDARNLGCYLAVGTALCEVGELAELEAEAQISLIDLPWVSAGQSADVRLNSMPSLTITGVIGDVARASEASRSVDVSHPAARRDESAETVRYEARISFPVDTTRTVLRPGASGWARIDAAWEPLGRRIWRSIRRTFQD